MRLLNFRQFFESNLTPTSAPTMKFGKIELTDQDRKKIQRIIANALSEYGIPTVGTFIKKFGNKEVNTTILSKAINNHTLLRKLAYDRDRKIITNASNAEEFIEWIQENIYDLINPNGKYFDVVYKLLSSTHNKGDSNELYGFEVFKQAFKQKTNQDITINKGTINQDKFGDIDGIFRYNNKEYTIQAKPIAIKRETGKPFHISCKDGYYYIISRGAIKSPKTNYLILSDEKSKICYIFRCGGITTEWNNSAYKIPVENLSYTNHKITESLNEDINNTLIQYWSEELDSLKLEIHEIY